MSQNQTLILVIVLASLIPIILVAIIYWKIFSKAGYNGGMGLLMFIPIANIIVLCILAFGEWPIYKELNWYRQQAAMRTGGGAMPDSQGNRYPFR